jgi:hypothetical protein
VRPTERIMRVRTCAALMAGIMQSKSVQLSQIALKIPGPAKEPSITRRLERLLDTRALRVRAWYAPIARAWLVSAARTTGEVRLIIDTTKVSFAHQLLMVALAFQRRAIPIGWTWRKGAKGHSSVRVQIALLASVRSLLPKNVKLVIVGDSEFEAGELQAQLDVWGWSYVLRQKPTDRLQSQGEAEAFSDEFSAGLVAGGEPSAWQRLMASLRLCLRRRLRIFIYSQPVFLPGSGTPYIPHRVKAARGPSSSAARSASIRKAHRALALALTGTVDLALPKPGGVHPFSLTPCLAGLATPVAALEPPRSSPALGACHSV